MECDDSKIIHPVRTLATASFQADLPGTTTCFTFSSTSLAAQGSSKLSFFQEARLRLRWQKQATVQFEERLFRQFQVTAVTPRPRQDSLDATAAP